MITGDLEQLKYPIGKFTPPQTYGAKNLEHFFLTIENFPIRLRTEVSRLTNEQLDTPYRPEGWSIRQVVHHCADSHMNALMRFKLALTEDQPTIKPYAEHLVAELADTKVLNIEPSLRILEGVHARWTALLKSMHTRDFERKYFHPEHRKHFTLYEATASYAWHCEHHLAHIRTLKQSKGW